MKKLTRMFLRGLLVIIPIFLTLYFLSWLFMTTERLFRVPLQLILPEDYYIGGMGVLSALLFILLVGFLVKIYVVSLLFKWLDSVMNRLPLVKLVYGSLRDLIGFLGGSGREGLQQVVALEFNGVKLIGFVTAGNTTLGDGHRSGEGVAEHAGNPEQPSEKLLSVYLPMSYQVGGYLVYVPESRCEFLDMPVRQAMQTILTANITSGDRN